MTSMTDSRATELLPCPFCGGKARMLGTKERWFNPACSNAECGCEWTDSYATEAEAIAAWNTRATHGTLTADDIRDLIERHSDAAGGNGRDFHNGAYTAIADELNAELGSGTCENIAPDYLDFLCSKCGFVHYHSDENDTGDGNDWNYCPNCGKRVSA